MNAFRLTSLPFFARNWGGVFMQLGRSGDPADQLGELATLQGWTGLTAVQSAAGASATFTITRSEGNVRFDVSEAGLDHAIRSFADQADVIDALAIGPELGALDRYAARLNYLELRPRIVALAYGAADLADRLQHCGYTPVSDGGVWTIFCRREDIRQLPPLLRQPSEAEIAWSAGREAAHEAELAELRSRLGAAFDEVQRLDDEVTRSQRRHAGELSRLRSVLDHLAGELSAVSAVERDVSSLSELVLVVTREQAELGAARILQRRFRGRSLFPFSARRRAAEALKRRQALVLRSGLFDGAWYLHRNRDVAERAVDPLAHFVDHGSLEGRDPGPGFDTHRYLHAYPDVAESRVEPFMHYVIWGRCERRLDWRLAAT